MDEGKTRPAGLAGYGIVDTKVRRRRVSCLHRTVAPEVMEPLIKDKLDAVLHTAATIPMKWIGMGVHKGGRSTRTILYAGCVTPPRTFAQTS